jgi:LytR cell envelope-related transcriptional attenuator
MSTPKKTGAGSRLRTAGMALFALSALAAVIGLVLVLNRTQQTTATQPPVPTPTQAPGAASPRPSVIPFPPVASSPAETPEAPAPGASPADTGGEALVGGKGLSRSEVRVYNNSTIRGLAARAAGDLGAAGWTVVEVGNYARGIIPTTTVYYQEDTGERADAEAIAAAFGMRVEPRFPGISHVGPGVVVIVTNDYAH